MVSDDTAMKTESKVALITGAGSGIGKQAALALAGEGFALVLAGRQRKPLEATAAEVVKLGARALVVPTDVSKPAAVKALFTKAKKAFGRLDLLFNNAGIFGSPAPLEDQTPEQWKQVVDINLTGAFFCTQEAFRIMKSQKPRGGRIINNGSISAHAPRPNSAPYTATKHAIMGLTRSTSLDGRKYDIACSQIDIGNTATAMTKGMNKGMAQADGSIRPEPTFDVDHVGRAIAFIAGLPLDANVQFLTIMATKMPFIGRG
jgi:NAD(P)-dependent dehydrogenase (short-subunit alcohol dehydrogenase family)